MTTDRWDHIDRLFSEALDLDQSDRSSFIRRACGKDTELMEQLLKLLNDFDSACEYFDHFELELLDPMEAELSPLIAGQEIGAYQIGEQIGRGGMSVVYQGHRIDGAYEESVAIKVLKKGLDTEAIIRRFQKERQVLANLRHSSIATLLDGGVTPEGQPYLVMEHIDGLPLDQAIRSAQFDMEQRLRLFLQITSAVQQAHNQLVVHRDIKPGNILLKKDGKIKLLDFGIAKLMDDVSPLATQAGQRFFTPQYAAPEQVNGEPISTATDVYQLGLLLFEILTDQRLEFMPDSELRFLPSAQLTDQSLRKRLQGDLDIIISKALRKDPLRRYNSAGEMASDIEAFLAHRPIKARPESWGYLAGKFVQRNRLGILAASLLFLSLLAGIIGTSWQANNANTALKKESEARQKAEAINNFLVYLFESADPYARQDSISGKDLRLEDFLRQSLPPIRSDLRDQPEVQLELLDIMSKLHGRLSLKQESYDIGKEVLKLTEDTEGKQSKAYADRSLLLAGAAADIENFSEADSLFRIAIKANQEIYGLQPKHLAVVFNDYGILKYTIGHIQEADSLYRKALDIMRYNGIPDTTNYAQTLTNQTQSLMALGKQQEAYDALHQSIRLQEMAGLGQSIYMTHARNQMASLLVTLDSLDAALRYQQEALAGFDKFLGQESHFYALGLYQLARIHEKKGEYTEQEQSILHSLAILGQIYGKKNVSYAICLSARGRAESKLGKFNQALTTHQEAFTIFKKNQLTDKVIISLVESIMIHEKQGNLLLAEKTLTQAKQEMEALSETHPSRALIWIRLAHLRILQKKLSEAQEYYQKAKEILSFHSDTHPYNNRLVSLELKLDSL